MGSAPTKTHIPNRNGTKKGNAVYQAQILKRSLDSNINPARTGTSSTPRKAQNITPASLVPGRFAPITCSPRVVSPRKVSRFIPLNRYYIIIDEVSFDNFLVIIYSLVVYKK
jgi:hypothetical protein